MPTAVCGPPTLTTVVHSVSEPLFQRGSSYQLHRPDYPDSLFAWLAKQCPQREHALDMGCGTGQASRGLEPWFQHVLGADLSLKQLQSAPPSRTQYLASRASPLPFADHCLDLISVAQAFHWFDADAFFAEAGRCLRKGGLLALISYGICEVEGLGSLIQDFHDKTLGPWWPAERDQVVAGYPEAHLDWPDCAFPASYIERQWSAGEMLGYLDTWSALVQARKAGKDPLTPFGIALNTAWGPGKRLVRWPLRVKAWHKP